MNPNFAIIPTTISQKRERTRQMLATIQQNQRRWLQSGAPKRRHYWPQYTTDATIMGDTTNVKERIAILLRMSGRGGTTRLVLTESGVIAVDTPDTTNTFDASPVRVSNFIDHVATDEDIKQAYTVLQKYLSAWQRRRYT